MIKQLTQKFKYLENEKSYDDMIIFKINMKAASKESLTQSLSCEFCKSFKNVYWFSDVNLLVTCVQGGRVSNICHI